MNSQFERDRTSYRDAVNRSIGFSGSDVDFFTKLKADDLVSMLRRRLGPVARARVLDVGSGPGATDAHLAPFVGELHGVDVALPLVEAAAEANPAVRYHHYDGERLPFEDGAFDASFAICVLHHVEIHTRAKFVREMARVTRAGGLVALYEHNPLNPLTRVAVARCDFDEDVQLLHRSEVVRLFEAAGCRVVEERWIVFFPWRGNALRTIERGLAWLPLGAQHVVAGRVG